MKNLVFIFLLVSELAFAQGGAIADLKFEEAETAYNNGDYELTLKKVDEFEKVLGNMTSKSLYLRVVSQDKLFNPANFYTDEKQFDLYKSLTVNVNKYLAAMEKEGLDDKFREVYAISENLKEMNLPKDKAGWLKGRKELEERERIKAEQDRMEAERKAEQARIKAEQDRIAAEKSAEEQREKDKYTAIGIGYYGGTNSLGGFSVMGFTKGVSFGLDFRYGSAKEGKDGSWAIMPTLTKNLSYPFYVFAGAGYGERTFHYYSWLHNMEMEETYSTGLETQIGIGLKTGNIGVLRTGISLNNFDVHTTELVFGFLINLN